MDTIPTWHISCKIVDGFVHHRFMNNESGDGDWFLIVTGYLDKIDVLIDEVLLTNILQKRT